MQKLVMFRKGFFKLSSMIGYLFYKENSKLYLMALNFQEHYLLIKIIKNRSYR